MKQGRESSLVMSMFPCLVRAQCRAWWLFQNCLLTALFSVFFCRPFFSTGTLEIYSTRNLPCESIQLDKEDMVTLKELLLFCFPQSALFEASFANVIRHHMTKYFF